MRSAPSKGFLAREQHRVLLTVHALVMISGLSLCAFLNRRFSPDRFWVQWVALLWGAVFLAHLAVFSRSTLATMGGRKKLGGPGGSELHPGGGAERRRIEERPSHGRDVNLPGTSR